MFKFSKERKRKNKIRKLSIIVVSLTLAIGINLYIFNSPLGKNLQTNVLKSGDTENRGDIYLEKIENDLVLKNNKNINNLKNISFSIAYNPENIKIIDIKSEIEGTMKKIENEDGLKTIVIDLKNNKTLEKNSKILTIKSEKTIDKLENINLINSNFTDSENQLFLLSSSGIEF